MKEGDGLSKRMVSRRFSSTIDPNSLLLFVKGAIKKSGLFFSFKCSTVTWRILGW